MKYVMLAFLWGAIFAGEGLAARFEIPDVGVVLSLPDGEGWTGVPDSPPGTLFRRDGTQGKLRVHLSREASSPEEALEATTARLKEAGRSQMAEGRFYRFLSSRTVVTASGLKGVVGDYGFRYPDGERVWVQRYMFLRADGRSFCVCATLGGEAGERERYERIILDTLALLPGKLGGGAGEWEGKGAAEARADFDGGIYRIRSYGLGGFSHSAADEYLRATYGVEKKPVAGCVVTLELVARARGYNATMRALLNERFGNDIFEEARLEGAKREASGSTTAGAPTDVSIGSSTGASTP